jgi:G6PDH family F420-dependent oxidoreductase
MELGYFLSCEEFGPHDLLAQAQRVEEVGMTEVWISDHFHPWSDRQGHSPFVWSVLGALATSTSLRLTTAVTCPTTRIHPAIIAHAAATVGVMADGRFRLGVGTGENLNEHVLGDPWPEVDVRLEQLEEAIEVIRLLWSGGVQSHRGTHYTVQNARLYDLPDTTIDVIVSGFGQKATELAGRIGDGFACTGPDEELVKTFRSAGGGDDKPVMGALKVCHGEDEAAARRLAHEIWAQAGVPGELNQELPMPAHFEQATELVTEEMVAESIVCGNDPERFVEAIRPYQDAGFTHLYLQQVGPDQAEFLTFFDAEIRPRL